MTAPLLAAAGLVLLAGAAPGLSRLPLGRHLVHGGALLACLAFAAAGFGALLRPDAGVLALPIGPAWGPMLVALDGLSAWFLLLLGLTGACSALFALAHGRAAPPRVVAAYPLFLAGMALTLLAADGFTLVLGFELMSLASWALVAADHAREGNRRAARLYLGFAAFGAACLIPALGLLAGAGAGDDFSFAALREGQPQGWRAAAVLALAVAGAGSKAGLAPFHAWLPLAHPAAPVHVSALMSGAMTKVAIYVLARVVLDLAGPAQPLWWGVPLIALGAASAVLGALRANLETEGKTLLACSTIENIGLIAMGLGLAACLRAADLGTLSALAAGAALLHAMAHGLFKTGLFLGMGEVGQAAGSHRLDRLGGLVHAMPLTAACMGVAALSAASLPPLSGFAGEWLLLQAMLSAWRVGDLPFQILVAAAAALAALAAALGAAAMVRLLGMVFLGRPRGPMGAMPGDGPLPARLAILLPALLTLGIGLLPGAVLRLAEGALLVLTRQDLSARAGWGGIRAGEGTTDYLPLALALLVGAAILALWLVVRREAPAGVATGPAWDCGQGGAPDPLAQPSAAGLGQPLRRMLGTSLLAAHETVEMPGPGEARPARLTSGFADPAFALLLHPLARARDAAAARAERLRDLTLRQCLGLGFATLVGLLALLALLGEV